MTSLCVFICDDNSPELRETARIAKAALKACEPELHMFTKASSLTDALAATKPDIAILDIRLADGDGIALAKRVLDANAQTLLAVLVPLALAALLCALLPVCVRHVQTARKIEDARRVLALQSLYAQSTKPVSDALHTGRHDTRSHMNALALLMRSGQNAEALSYVRGLCASMADAAPLAPKAQLTENAFAYAQNVCAQKEIAFAANAQNAPQRAAKQLEAAVLLSYIAQLAQPSDYSKLTVSFDDEFGDVMCCSAPIRRANALRVQSAAEIYKAKCVVLPILGAEHCFCFTITL